MSRSRARKNRFKYQTLRRLGCFKIFLMDYPSQNGNVYPSMNFGSMRFSKELVHELKHRRGSFFSITSHVDEGLEHNLDVICAVMGVNKENLVINHPTTFTTTVKDSVGTPWVDSVRESIQKAEHKLRENRRERIMKSAEIIGEDIEVDSYLLQESIKVFRQLENQWSLVEVNTDTPEWIAVMIAVCRNPEQIGYLKGQGFNYVKIARNSMNGIESTQVVDTYYLYDTGGAKEFETHYHLRFPI